MNRDDSPEQLELLLSGLVCKRKGKLQVKNRIYQAVFDQTWVQHHLTNLCPYSDMLQGWVASKRTDPSWLLRGQALQEAQDWSQDKSLGNVNYQFLQASQIANQQDIQQKLEAERLQEVSTRLRQTRKIAQLRSLLLGVVSIGLLMTLGLSIFSWQQFYGAKLNEVKALASSSQGLFASDRQLDAMIDAIQAQHIFNRFNFDDQDTGRQVAQVLDQAIFSSNEFNRLSGHQGSVLTVDISADGQLIATGSNDKTVKIWRRDGTLLHTLPHQNTVHRVAFSPDSSHIVAGSLDGKLQIWSVSGKLEQTIQAHADPVWGVAYSPDGKTVASASGDRTVKLWNLNGNLLTTLTGAKQRVWNVAFSPDGQLVAGVVTDGSIKLWKTNGQLLKTLEGHQFSAWDVAFCPGKDLLVSVGSDRSVRLWSLEGNLIQTLSTEAALLGVDCSDNGEFIAASGRDNAVTIWKSDGTFIRTLKKHGAVVRDVALSPDGLIAASASDDGLVKLWQRNQYLLRPLYGHDDVIWSIAASPDHDLFASSGGTNGLILWRNSATGRQFTRLPWGQVAFGPNGYLLINQFSTLSLFRLEGQDPPSLILQWQQNSQFSQSGSAIFALAISPNGQYLASGEDNGMIKIWNLKGELLHSIKADSGRIWQVAFSPDSQTLASGSESGAVNLWSLDGTRVATPVKQGGAVWGVAFSPDGKTIAATSRNDILHLWNTDGTSKQIKGQSRGLSRVAFSPDGTTIATGGIDTTVKLWNRDGSLQRVLPGHSDFITSLAYTRQGNYLVSGGDSGKLILWSVDKIQSLNSLQYACDWVKDYLRTNQELSESDRHLCDRP